MGSHGWFDKMIDLLKESSGSRYTQASIVYLLYVAIIVFINLSLSPSADSSYCDDFYYSADDYLKCVYLFARIYLYKLFNPYPSRQNTQQW